MSASFDGSVLQFSAVSSHRGGRISSSDFVGRVPVVLTFIGAASPVADELVRGFDKHLQRFGHERVQLLLVVDDDPEAWGQRLDTSVTLVRDEGISAAIGLQGDDGGRDARVTSVFLDTNGIPVDQVHQLPQEDPTAAVLVMLDRLRQMNPERFAPLHPQDGERTAGADDDIVDVDSRVPDSSRRIP